MRASFLALLPFLFLSLGASVPCVNPEHPKRLPVTFDGQLMPRELGCWFPRAWEATEPDGFKAFLDAVGERTAYDQLAVSSRLTQHESISPEALRFQADAAKYGAEKYGITILPDAEIRLSRKAFHAAHPDKSLWRIRFVELEQKAGQSASIILNETDLSDHYTHNYKYEVLGVRPIKVWSFSKTADGLVDPASLRDATAEAEFQTEENPRWCQFSFKPESAPKDRFLCVAVAFEYLYPDVYSQEALDFEAKIFRAHGGMMAGGLVKDEWGLLPCHDGVPLKDHFWFSDAMAAAYKAGTSRDFVDDLFLMHLAQAGRDAERIQAIDALQKMNFRQLIKFERQVYEISKENYGPNAMVATHPTWHCYPNVQEFRKNSLFWWRHPRDFAQTDEAAPYACRTGMSKREGRVWFNEFYADGIAPYIREEWSCTAGGGRQNIHPFCCMPNNPLRTDENFGHLPILDAGLDAARASTRLLNFKCAAPLFSPVAVVFGHWGCMNWARLEYGNLTEALEVCDFFAERGFPADLIPSSEINEKTMTGLDCWTLNERGFLQYGAQEYRLVVFYAETDSDRADFAKLETLNQGGKTRIVRVPGHITEEEIVQTFETTDLSVASQTPWEAVGTWGGKHSRPPFECFSRRLDGSLVWTNASEENPVGKPIVLKDETVPSNDLTRNFTISAEANGVLACRFDPTGSLEMLTAAGLKSFQTQGLELSLAKPADVVLWKDAAGSWQGIYQAEENDLPEELAKLPVNWRFLQK
ncbi:MAG: hypothetical protein IJK97_15160 [Thermoguttaceae bacterium]|nr:hypothetical protein [Thermoguttaceae bacterium]MBR0193453.1 hypothetical protein [Thermoguttaceae bacterium]